jgi:hypothetical protein
VGSGNASGKMTDDSETHCLGNWEVVGGICGTADRGGVSKSGSKEQFVEG